VERDEAGTLESHVTVIIPCFNAEKYIGEAIESVFSQTHVNGQSKLPTGGQQKCPLVATKTAHTRPTDLPTWGLVALAVRGVLV
jgi:hypothetical protein